MACRPEDWLTGDGADGAQLSCHCQHRGARADRQSVCQSERRTDVRSLYDLLARVLGTRPIYVRLAPEAFLFACGDVQTHVRPVVWFDGVGASAKIVALGDQPPPAGAVPMDLAASPVETVPLALRQNGLNALIRFGLKSLGGTGTIQRPVVVFQNDAILARAFGNDQRRALAEAAAANKLAGTRFQ